MNNDEIKFFKTCYRLLTHIKDYEVYEGKYTPYDIIDILSEFIPNKRMWYYLKKWDKIGFINYGVSLGTGWFEDDKIPERYLELVK